MFYQCFGSKTWRAALLAFLVAFLPAALTIVVATPAQALPITGASHKVYVSNSDDNTVTPIDLATLSAGTAIAVGGAPGRIAITPDGATAYVITGTSSVTPIDTATNTAGTPIPVVDPFYIAISPDGSRAYVTSSSGSSVTPIDLITKTAAPAINTSPVFAGPVAITPDGSTAYVFSRFGGGTEVMPIDTATNTAGTAFQSNRSVRSALISPDGSTLYLSLRNGSTHGITAIDVATQASTHVVGFGAPWRSVANLGITPDGSTLHWADFEDFAELDTAGLFIAPGTTALGSFSSREIVLTPDGLSAFIVNSDEDTVSYYDIASGMVTATINVGSFPVALAFTPDQAPVARLSVTRAPIGFETTFDASASTIAFGSISQFLWDFGDGTTDVTGSPTTTHTYTSGSHTASVTAVSTFGTTFGRVFTGQTVMKNGSFAARATALGSLADLGAPVVSQVTPTNGLIAGGTSVTILGAGFTGATQVTFGGQAAGSVVVNGDNSISAITPAGIAPGFVDVVVTNPVGVSAVTTVSRFRYLGEAPIVEVPCNSASCAIQIGTPGLTVTGNLSCTACSLFGGAAPVINSPSTSKCPLGQESSFVEAGYLQAQQSGAGGGVFSSLLGTINYNSTVQGFIEAGDKDALALVEVCYLPGIPVPVPVRGAGGSARAGEPKSFTLKTCAKTGDVAPCVVEKSFAEDGSIDVSMLLPASGSTFHVVTQDVKAKKPKPNFGNEGDSISIRGKNLSAVEGVVVGGVEAVMDSRTNKEIVVTIPDGAQSGLVTLLTLTGTATAKKPLYVGVAIVRISKAGKVGGKAKIKGFNLIDATEVLINGVEAEIVKATDKVVIATVPEGATSGLITVTTPSGSAISATEFTVK